MTDGSARDAPLDDRRRPAGAGRVAQALEVAARGTARPVDAGRARGKLTPEVADRAREVSGYREVAAASSKESRPTSVTVGLPSLRDRSRSMGTPKTGGW